MTEVNSAVSAEEMEQAFNSEEGFESVQPTYRTPGKSLMKGDVVQGAYVGTEDNKFGGKNYKLRTTSGIEVLNGSGSLTKQIEDANPKAGDILRVTYEGSTLIKDGKWKGKEAHQYKVQIKRV